jgi:protein O-mannosyl-transferase
MSKKIKKPSSSTPAPIVNKSENTQTTSSAITQAAESPNFWLNTRYQAAFIFALSVLLYANTLTLKFCQDDAIVLTDNMFTQKGIDGIDGILSYDTFYGFFKEAGKANLVSGGRYRPFTLIMFAVEFELFGDKTTKKISPFVGHFLNILWFGLTCVLLYFLLLKLLNYQKNNDNEPSTIINPTLIAFITAVLFAAHPIHTEAVANIKGRDEIMTLFGSLAAVWFSLKAFERGGVLNQILAFVLFLIALMSKENAITFVVITPLIYWFFIKTDIKTALKQTIPFVAATFAFIILRGMAFRNSVEGVVSDEQLNSLKTFLGIGSEPQMELMNNPFLKLVDNEYVAFNFIEKFATITYTLGKYIQLLIVPHPLTHDYYPRHIGIMGFGDWQVLLSIVVYGGLIALILRGWKNRSLVSFGIAFFLITLSIVSNVVFPVGTNMAERFIFMPSVGFCLVLAVLLAKLATKDNELSIKSLWFGATLGIIVLFGLKTITRNPAWLDDYTIFTTDIATSPNSAKLQTSVGGSTIEHVIKDSTLNEAAKKVKITEAMLHLQKGLEIHPTLKSAYLLMGNGYYYLRDFDNAINVYNKALQLDPNFKDVKANLALAKAEFNKNNLPKINELLAKAIAQNPSDFDKAIATYNMAVQNDLNLKNLKPDNALIYREGGKIMGQQYNNLPKSIELLSKAIELDPSDAAAMSYLGTAYGISNQPQKMIDVLTKAIGIRFDKNDALNIAQGYKQLGNVAKAIEYEQMARK